MKKTLSLLAVFAIAGMMSTPAQAADHYISGMAGMSWFQNMEADEALDGLADDEKDGLEYSFDSGLTVAAAIGCDYGSTRLEAEIGYQSNDLDAVDFKDNGEWEDDATALEGDVNLYSLMANGFYDIDLGGVELYAMAGVGVAQVNFDGVSDPERRRQVLEFNASETALAYQLGAGLAIPVGDGVMIDARYRYFATTDFTIGDDQARGLVGQDEDNDYTMNLSSHSALLGLRVML